MLNTIVDFLYLQKNENWYKIVFPTKNLAARRTIIDETVGSKNKVAKDDISSNLILS